jgi:transcriptional regulator with XRE-family HTH domain
VELRAIRRRLKRSMADVAETLGWSESTVSRLENGRRNIDAEEVSALLAVYGVTGSVRDRLMAVARTPDESSWVETALPGLPPESIKLATYEASAVKITDWSPLLIPGLLQTMEYSRAYMLSDGIPEAEVGARLMARQRRQEILHGVAYTAFIDETVLTRPIGGPRIMARQVRQLIDVAEEGSATIRVTPVNADGHAALVSPFMLMEFDQTPPIVHVELARSGVFLTGEKDTAIYPVTVDRLAATSLDGEESLRLLRETAGAMGSE